MDNVADVSYNGSYYGTTALVLKTDGILLGWGDNECGQMADGEEDNGGYTMEAPHTIMTGVKVPVTTGTTLDTLKMIASSDNYNKFTEAHGGTADPKADLNRDGKINFADLAIARNSKNFGK